jgi:hypothetical protein
MLAPVETRYARSAMVSSADPERLRAEAGTEMPRDGDVRAATVPGCVGGWVAGDSEGCGQFVGTIAMK